VGAGAASPLVNAVTVSGGGSASANASDSTVIAVPGTTALSIAKSHSGNFTQGQANAVYTVTVSNQAGASPTSGAVTVTENVPTGLTLASMAGTGWTCPSSGNTCTRSDSLIGGSSYPAITVAVNVASNAPASVTNSVTLSGGGDPNAHTATDVATISTPVTNGTPPGAISYWSANGTTVDSISGNNGVLMSGATYGPGVSGQAFSLDGIGSYVQVTGTTDISGPRSMAMWVYAQTSTSGRGMPLMSGGGADFWGILNGQPYIDHWGTPKYQSSLALKPNAWNHVAVTYDGSTVQFYVNGVAAAPVSGSLYSYSVGSYQIGGNTAGGSTTGSSFNGLLEEIYLYPRALTASEVQTLAGVNP
jgi:hypothetical protein